MKKTLLALMSILVAGSFYTTTLAQEKYVDLSIKPEVSKPVQKSSKDVIFFEGFETYTDFTTDLSPWITLQLTTGDTYASSSFDFPGEATAFAFMVFNPSLTVPSIVATHPAHTGDKYAVAVQYESTNDNKWLISPQITPTEGSELSFWVKSITAQYGLERFVVHVSTTGTEVANFTKISAGAYLEAPTAWTQFTFDLNSYAGTPIYFAIQYVSYDAFFFMLDDIEVTGTVAPTEYTVTFTVTDGTDAIEGATIAINEVELTTDAAGVATIDLVDGEYAYTVTKEGFVTVEGTATVAGEALAVAVEMEAEGPVTFPVTFTVIDQKELYTNIKFKGTPTGWATVAMVEEPTHTWTLTLQVEPGSHQWGAIEDDGSVDGIWLIEGPNPAFTVAADGTVTGQTSYTILAPGDKAVTFIVDISTLEGFDPEADFIDLAGSFTGWSGTDPFEVDAENANLYTWTTNADLRPGQILMFKFRLNGAWDPTEENPHQGAETPADPDGKLNRMFVVSAVEEENVYTAVWGENYTHNLGAVAALADIEVETGAVVADLNLPEMIEVELGVPSNLTGETVSLPVTWDTEEFSSAVAGEVMLHGEIALSYEDVTYFNGYALMAEVKVIITGTSVTTKPAFQLSVFPNPTSGDLNVVGGSQISSIRVMNMLGQQVMNVSNLGRENVTLSTSTLSAGIYIISVTDMNGATVSNRFVKR